MLNLQTTESQKEDEINENQENNKKRDKEKNTNKIKSNENSHKLSINSKKNDLFSDNSNAINNDIQELKNRIKLLEEKAANLEKKNIYYFNILKKNNPSLDYKRVYNDPVDEFIYIQRNKNLNGYNQFMIDINDKINDFIEDEKIRDKEKIEYYKKVNQLKEDIDYRINFIKLFQEKERIREIERNDINKNYYIINYNKNSGEINPNTNNYIYNYQRRYYGNPYNAKYFNNNTYMMPARISKNELSMNNQYISINNPEDICKYQIYDRYNSDYRKYKNNTLKRTGNNFIKSNDNLKYNNNKKFRVSSSTDNIFI